MRTRIRRTPEGPELPTWLLQELHTVYGDDLALSWNAEHKHWVLLHLNRSTSKYWPFASWKHEMMDRRLIRALAYWDTRTDTPESIQAERDANEVKWEARKRETWGRLDHDKVLGPLKKTINDYAGYPVYPAAIAGEELVPHVLKQPAAFAVEDLVAPTLKQSAAFGCGAGRSETTEELVRQTLGGE